MKTDVELFTKYAARYDEGLEVRVPSRVRERLLRLERAGDPDAGLLLGWVWRVAKPKSTAKAVALYSRAVKLHRSPVAMFNLANIGFERGRTAEGVRQLRRAARAGYLPAMLYLGQLHISGMYVAQSLPRAERWLRAAWGQGSSEAAMWLGWKRDFHDRGRWREAAVWYRRAAEGGVVEGMFNLAICLERGLGVRRDDRSASRWLTRAAALGDGDAKARLAERAKAAKVSRQNAAKASGGDARRAARAPAGAR